MADYERVTAATIREVLTAAEEMLTSRLPIEKVASDKNSITLEGEDGRVTITARREGGAGGGQGGDHGRGRGLGHSPGLRVG